MRWKVQSLLVAGAVYAWATAAAAQDQIEGTPPAQGALYDSSGALLAGTPPRWGRLPQVTIDDFPSRLLQRSSGRWFAVVACRAERDGRLSDCKAERESEADLGLGRAAVRIVRRGRMQAPVEPDATGAQPTVRITISFRAGG